MFYSSLRSLSRRDTITRASEEGYSLFIIPRMSTDVMQRMLAIEGVGLYWNGKSFAELDRELNIRGYSVSIRCF